MAKKEGKEKMRTLATGLRAKHGLTLIELLVVLVVIGLLSATGAAVLIGGKAQKINRQASEIAGFFKIAQHGALVSGKVQEVVVSDMEWSILPAGPVLKRSKGVTIRLLSERRQSTRQEAVLFYPDGSSTGAIVDISGHGETRRVSVDWLGRIYVDH